MCLSACVTLFSTHELLHGSVWVAARAEQLGMSLGGGCAAASSRTHPAVPQWSRWEGKAGLQWTPLDGPRQCWFFTNWLRIAAAFPISLAKAEGTSHVWTPSLTTLGAFSMAPAMENLLRLGGVFEYALKAEISVWTKLVLGTPRKQRVFHDASDLPHSRNKRKNVSPNIDHVEDSGAAPKAYTSLGLVAKRQSHAFVDPELFLIY